MSADENVKKMVGTPLCSIIDFNSSLTLCQYAELPVMLLTYRDSLDIKTDELLVDAISRNCSIVG